MAAPPRFATLRETDLAIKDGPIDGAMLGDSFKRLFALFNPSLDRLNNICAKGITLSETSAATPSPSRPPTASPRR